MKTILFQMRTYKRKTQRATVAQDIVLRAVKAVAVGQSCRAAAKRFWHRSRPGEQWIRCAAVNCVNWAHELCTDGSDVFICPVCEDDD